MSGSSASGLQRCTHYFLIEHPSGYELETRGAKQTYMRAFRKGMLEKTLRFSRVVTGRELHIDFCAEMEEAIRVIQEEERDGGQG